MKEPKNTIKNSQRVSIFEYPVDIKGKKALVEFALESMKKGHGLHVVTINPEIIHVADKTPFLKKIIRSADLIIPDSIGIAIAAKSLGFLNIEQVPGIEFSWDLMKKCQENGLKVGFLGGSPEIIESMKTEILKEISGLNIVFSNHGYFKDEELPELLSELKRAEPHLLLVALGSPKQDIFINDNKKLLNHTLMIGVGGSFDVWAKKVKRAPVLFRIFGLEWFYRLLKQPSRFNRMFPVLPLFMARILFDRKNLRKEYGNG